MIPDYCRSWQFISTCDPLGGDFETQAVDIVTELLIEIQRSAPDDLQDRCANQAQLALKEFKVMKHHFVRSHR